MNNKAEQRDNDGHTDPSKGNDAAGEGTEAAQKGGREPARRQAERDFEDSAKESAE